MARVYVGSIDPRTTEREIEDEFRVFGVLRSVWVARKPPGYAFIDFDDKRDAMDAIKSLNGKSGWRVEMSRGSGGGGGGSGARGRGGDEKKCYECNETGHFARECRLRVGQSGAGSGRRVRSRSRSRSPRYRHSSPSYRRRSLSPRRRRSLTPPRRRSMSPSPPPIRDRQASAYANGSPTFKRDSRSCSPIKKHRGSHSRSRSRSRSPIQRQRGNCSRSRSRSPIINNHSRSRSRSRSANPAENR
eukprot:c11120_g1_i1 orf=116-850(+)